MTSGKLWWIGAGSLILAASLLVSSWPYAASTFHLEAGGRALERALSNTDALDWWYVGPRKAQDQRSLQQAIAHLEQASKTPHALRLLGQAYFCQGDLTRAVEALEQFLVKRPDHRLGHLELAAAYALMDQRLQEIEYVDLVARLTGAAVSAPDLNGPVRFQPEGWKSEYIYPTTFGLPPTYGDRPTLFVHAGSQVTYTVPLTAPSTLRFGMGLDPRSLDWGGDGATFEVYVDGSRVFLEHLSIAQALEGWQEREIDLRAYTDQSIQLALVTTPGPNGDIAADWAGWGEPRLEAPEAAAYRQVVSSKPWVGHWQKLGVTAEHLIQTGESMRKAGRYEEALAWYRWAELLLPGPGDPSYYAGLAHEDQERWDQALDAYRRGLDGGGFRQVRRSSLHYQSGLIYQLHLEPRQLDAALAAYDAAFEANKFGGILERADCHYRRGEVLWWQRMEIPESIAEFERAIERDPEHVSAYILMGAAIYAQHNDRHEAEAQILKAIEMAPQNKWAFYHLGEIYRQEGMETEARAMYEHALALDAHFAIVQEQLAALDPIKRDK